MWDIPEMRIQSSRSATAIAAAAVLSLVATPALARGWHGYGHHRHHRGGVDAGDVIAGVLILGGIAAIASAASKNSQARREQDYRYPDSRYPGSRYPDGRDDRADRGADDRDAPDGRYGAPGRDERTGASRDGEAMNEAVESCLVEIERGSRAVESVDTVRRSGDGWTVEGQVSGDRDFACDVGADGRIRRATVGGRAL